MKKIVECRERSQSVWLHFPHVELVFLLFAFEGSVASEVSAVRENASPVVLSMAIASLVSLLCSHWVVRWRSAATRVQGSNEL